MNIRRNLAAILAVAASFFCAARPSFAQAEINGPTALIVSYRANPGFRAQFRAIMAGEGVAQLNQWQKDGVFASYDALFTAYAARSAPDMFLVLRFNHFTDLARWQKIEESRPGGLPDKAQSIAVASDAATTDIIAEQHADATTPDSQFFVLEYDVIADAPTYNSYVRGYVTPQFDAWMKAGVLSSYATFVNQNPAGARWSSFILLEYKDLHALAARESAKNQARAELAASNPVWKKWSDDKTAIRKEKAAIPALSLK